MGENRTKYEKQTSNPARMRKTYAHEVSNVKKVCDYVGMMWKKSPYGDSDYQNNYSNLFRLRDFFRRNPPEDEILKTIINEATDALKNATYEESKSIVRRVNEELGLVMVHKTKKKRTVEIDSLTDDDWGE